MNKKKFGHYIKLFFIFLILLSSYSTVSHSVNITRNEVEDPRLTGEEFEGADPNVLTILDLSGSMGRNFGGEQVGDWDGDDVFARCPNRVYIDRNFEPASGEDDDEDNNSVRRERVRLNACGESISGLNSCIIENCTGDGHTCISDEQLEGVENCIFNTLENVDNINDPLPVNFHGQPDTIACIYDYVCVDEYLPDQENPNDSLDDKNCIPRNRSVCNTTERRTAAAYAIAAASNLTQCSSFVGDGACVNESNPGCNSIIDSRTFYYNCMSVSGQTILPEFSSENCDQCTGSPLHGSTRMDSALNVFFNVLDADDSLQTTDCGGESCKSTIERPFFDVSDFITRNKSNSNLVRNILTDEDAELLPVNFLPMSYSGQGNNDACDPNSFSNPQFTIIDNQSAFRMADGGFQGGNGDALKRVWDFYRDQGASGGTPLAHIIGFDDSVNPTANDGSTFVRNDALLAFSNGLSGDDSVECRPQFAIVITDGDDSCAGDCSNNSSACSGGLGGFNNESNAFNNPNRRSSVQAVSNLRTYFTRSGNTIPHPDPDISDPLKKEVLTFVIGLGINDERSIRALNAMALAGGTHTKGIIKHVDPATGDEFGTVSVEPLPVCINLDLDIDHPQNLGRSAICGSQNDGLDLFRSIARGDNIGSSNARLRNCGNGNSNTPDIFGECLFEGASIFDNDYFNEGIHNDGTEEVPVDLNGFAFLANSPEELTEAIQDILLFIDNFVTTGVAPSAPQTAGNVTLRDRVFLALTNPLAGERLWQGRLALYSFVNDPGRPGTSLIVRKPTGSEDFTSGSIDLEDISIFSDGRLNSNAQDFHWEAGNLLARRDPGTRNIFFTDTISSVTTSGTANYFGSLLPFTPEDDNGSLTPESFGIIDDDVTILESFPPAECSEDTPYDCSQECEEVTSNNIEDVDSSDCRDCIKDCFANIITGFLSGETGILPGEDNTDPLGHICSDGSTDFNPDSVDPEVCSVRLGDIFHSSPRTVASPSVLFFDTGFPFYSRAFQDRSAVVYAGANDGGLHAFHAGELVDTSGGAARNPFNGRDEALPFFDEGTGSEMFYYIPPTFFPDATSDISPETPFGPLSPPQRDYRFGDLKTYILGDPEHRSFFDGTVSIADIFIDGFDNGISPGFCDQDESSPGVLAEVDGLISSCGKEWHTVLISGFRNGGGGITALDITNANCELNGEETNCNINTTHTATDSSIFSGDSPGYPTHLWTVFDMDFGNTWSDPEIARVRLRGQDNINGESVEVFADRWIAFVGGGIDPVSVDSRNYGNAFYAIDITTGQIVYKFHPQRSIPDNLDSGSFTDQEGFSQNMQCELASEPGVFDINADGYTDLVYIGDTCGRLWRFDVSQPLNTSNSSGTGNISGTGLTIGTGGNLNRGTELIDASDWRADIVFCANVDPGQCGTDGNPAIPQTNVEPFYFPPTSAIDNIGRRHLIFQTGNRRDPTRIADFENEEPVTGTHNGGRLYNIIETYVPVFLSGSLEASGNTDRGILDSNDISRLITLDGDGDTGLFSIGSGTTEDGSGEYIVEYPNNAAASNSGIGGEKGVGVPVVINGALVFVTFAPTPVERALPCTPAFGDTRVFALDFVTGAPALSRIRGAVAANSNISSSSAGLQLSQGISSGTTLTFGSENSVILTISTSGNEEGASFIVWEVPIAVQTQTLFWEEVL